MRAVAGVESLERSASQMTRPNRKPRVNRLTPSQMKHRLPALQAPERPHPHPRPRNPRVVRPVPPTIAQAKATVLGLYRCLQLAPSPNTIQRILDNPDRYPYTPPYC